MDWFTSAKCPVDAETKEWLEDSFNWLIEEMGHDTLMESKIALPTEEHFPDRYRGTPSEIRRLLERVCGYMDVHPREVEIEFYKKPDNAQTPPPPAAPGEARHPTFNYQKRKGKFYLKLDIIQAAKPEGLVAAIAHELGHVILIGERRLDPKRRDYEPMTDLLTVFYGLGVFSANSAFSLAQWRNAAYHGGPSLQTDYMTEEMYGYALALFAYARRDGKPKWASHLGVNVRHYFKRGLKYLEKTGDTKVKPVGV